MPRGIPNKPKKPVDIPLDAVPPRPEKRPYVKNGGANLKKLAELIVEVAKLL
jgi:hypothetical protein